MSQAREFDFISSNLEKAMGQPGCPICRIRAEHELRYIRWLLWEYVNDVGTRARIVAALGYCPQHTWQIGLLEAQMVGNPVGNNIIYRHLAGVLEGRLQQYAQRALTSKQPRWKRWLRRLQPGIMSLPTPDELQPRAGCPVCDIRSETERTYLEWLFHRLSTCQDAFRNRYTASDGLCLHHLRQGLTLARRNSEAGVVFVIVNAIQRLAALNQDLDESNRNESWEFRMEEKTEGEKNAWLHALTFFGGNRQDAADDEQRTDN